MWAFYENIRFSSGMSSHRTLACTWILFASWTLGTRFTHRPSYSYSDLILLGGEDQSKTQDGTKIKAKSSLIFACGTLRQNFLVDL